MASPKNIAFVVNKDKPGAYELANRLVSASEQAGLAVDLTDTYPVAENFLRNKDLCCVLGGDGTILGVVDEALRQDVPLLGINRGKLGFLATFAAKDIETQWNQIIQGQYQAASRTLILCKTAKQQTVLGLNDIVIKNTQVSRLIELRVSIEGQCITEYSSDGLIFSTPTGSTAYNLSAGGPIIHASAHVMAMTPICPHTLSNRSIVFPDGTTLSVETLDTDSIPQLTVDGRLYSEDKTDFPLSIQIAPQALKLIQPLDYHHFGTIRNKLAWR